MQEYRRNEIRVGLTVVIGLLVLLFGFAFFKDWALSSDNRSLLIRFPTSAGLQSGDQVSVNGVKAGRVEAVMVERNGVLVRAKLGEEFALASDAGATIQMLELMGGKKIEIRQGISPEEFDYSHVMQGTVDPDIAGAFAMVGELESSVRSLTQKANKLLDNVNALAGDSVMVAAIKETVGSLRVLTRDMRTLVTDNKANAQDISRTLVSLTHRADTMIAELQPLLAKDLRHTESLLGGADTLLTDVRSIVTDIKTGRGLFQKIITDTTLTGRFDELLARVDTLTAIIIGGQMRIKIRL
jgi:phospholipid/cholesterol/gamma-HCH transport system substrate-binding protein